MTDNNRTEAVRYFWDLAQESYDAALREFKAASYNFAVNRLYYTLFYAVTSALLERNMSFVKHSGVRAAFHKEFIRQQLIDVKWGKLYDQLFNDRLQGDYVAMTEFDPQEINKQIYLCKEFLDTISSFINTDK